MAAWTDHFESLSESKVPESSTLQHLESNINYLHACSLANEDFLLDVQITIEEIAVFSKH